MKTESKASKIEFNTKTLIITAFFIAFSFIGSTIKVFGTIAFDSLPGFLAALLLGPFYGAAIGFLGHLFTALTSGFPLSVPLHMVIALTMAITMLGFGFSYRFLKNKLPVLSNLVITGVVGTILNGPVSLAFSIGTVALMTGMDAALGLLPLLPVLIMASIANIVISIILFKALENVWGKIR